MKTTNDEEMKVCSGKPEGLPARLIMENQGESATLHVVIPLDVWQELTRVSIVAEPYASDAPEVEVNDSSEVELELAVIEERSHYLNLIRVQRVVANPHRRIQRVVGKGILYPSVRSHIPEFTGVMQELWVTPGKAPPSVL